MAADYLLRRHDGRQSWHVYILERRHAPHDDRPLPPGVRHRWHRLLPAQPRQGLPGDQKLDKRLDRSRHESLRRPAPTCPTVLCRAWHDRHPGLPQALQFLNEQLNLSTALAAESGLMLSDHCSVRNYVGGFVESDANDVN